MKSFPLLPDMVMIAAMDGLVHLTISFQCETLTDSLRKANQLEKLLSEMVALGLIIRPSHEVKENG